MDIYLSLDGNKNDKIFSFELDNKIKVVFISDPNINVSSCSIAVGAGSFNDTYPGTAHFLEHLLFMGSEKYPEQNDYHSYIQINGGYDNAFTANNMTCYYLVLESSFLKKGIEMLSWFFRAPLLNESHIQSEMEIIDSEHNKNILNDNWIMDDIFKKFIKTESKYTKFGTGNLKSLDGITKNDIFDFYNKYYTSDNLYICVVDSKNINQMIDEYLIYFQSIPTKLYSNDLDRFSQDKLELVDNNLIFFKSSSDYNILNFYLIMDGEETNLIDYQLIYFINYLIGTEYYDSLGYFLKENNIIKNLSANIEYFYDFSANLNIQLTMVSTDTDCIYKSYWLITKLIEQLGNINEHEFIAIYNNYKKIKTLQLLYDSTNDPVSITNSVVENMTKYKMSGAIVRNYKVPEYNETIYQKYNEIIKSIKIKISTNINYKNISDKDFTKSLWYSSSYFLDNLILKKDFKMDEIKFIFSNTIGIKNFLIKNIILNISIDKSSIPELIYSSDKLCRKVYLLEFNKYEKPIGSITIIRKNELLLDKYNRILMEIYGKICNKILNYYLETISYYKLSFNMSVYREYLIYNFIGIDYELNFFITQITKKIYPNIVLYNNPESKKYFNEIIDDIKENINNFKYNTPYAICSKYLSCLLDNYLLPEEKLNFISGLTWDDFVLKINECLKYSYEYYLLIGIKKYGYSIGILPYDDYVFNNDQYINSIIDSLELSPNKYLITENKKIIKKSINNFCNFIIKPFDTNPNEINNCLIRYWICGNKINLISKTNFTDPIDIEITKSIIKSKLIMDFVSEILNEPLFDKIRTIDKLGYIVRANNKIINPSTDSLYFIIFFLIQSSYSIDRISESIKNFNKFIIKNIKNNYDEYLEKFRLLKESKLIDFKKPFSELVEELNSYIMSIVDKNYIFNINPLYWDICSEIDFSKDIEPIIYSIVKPKSKYYDIILKKN